MIFGMAEKRLKEIREKEALKKFLEMNEFTVRLVKTAKKRDHLVEKGKKAMKKGC